MVRKLQVLYQPCALVDVIGTVYREENYYDYGLGWSPFICLKDTNWCDESRPKLSLQFDVPEVDVRKMMWLQKGWRVHVRGQFTPYLANSLGGYLHRIQVLSILPGKTQGGNL